MTQVKAYKSKDGKLFESFEQLIQYELCCEVSYIVFRDPKSKTEDVLNLTYLKKLAGNKSNMVPKDLLTEFVAQEIASVVHWVMHNSEILNAIQAKHETMLMEQEGSISSTIGAQNEKK